MVCPPCVVAAFMMMGTGAASKNSIQMFIFISAISALLIAIYLFIRGDNTCKMCIGN